MKIISIVCFTAIAFNLAISQTFFFGNDLSYVNEMEDCGVIYRENKVAKDPYRIFADQGGNLVRLRLWKNPSWYKNLNQGRLYSDLGDVMKSIGRAKTNQMQVLLDFHLSDNWADPSKQLVPSAWESVVNNLPVLKDSLYRYILTTLQTLNQNGLLPEMVQIGNETNKGILLSPADNAQYTLDWPRNAVLFNAAIAAVRDFEKSNNKKIKVAIHAAGPKDSGWLIDQFVQNGVSDFDLIGISYYWAWHKPSTIAETGALIQALKNKYQKEVMIFETGYIWTNSSQDQANNIISEVHPDYAPASPENQKKWLIDLTREVMIKGGSGVIYWEPAWVSSPCFTQWGQGSHQEHATFFDFDHNLLDHGGIAWMNYNYHSTVALETVNTLSGIKVVVDSLAKKLQIETSGSETPLHRIRIYDMKGSLVLADSPVAAGMVYTFSTQALGNGIYILEVWDVSNKSFRQKIIL